MKNKKTHHCVQGGVTCQNPATHGTFPMMYCEEHFIPKPILKTLNLVLDRLYNSLMVAEANKVGSSNTTQIHIGGLTCGYQYAIEELEREFGFISQMEAKKINQ